MQINESTNENTNTSSQSTREEWKEQSRSILLEMGTIVDFDTPSTRAKAGEFEFTYEEAVKIFPLWQKLPFKGMLMMWDLYGLTAGVYFINHKERSFGAAGGRWTLFAHLDEILLMSPIPKDSSDYADFILWCMKRCNMDKLRFSTLTKPQYQNQILKDRVPEEYLDIATNEVDATISMMYSKMNQIYSPPGPFFRYGHFSEIIHPDQYHAWLFCQGYELYKRSSDVLISDLNHQFHSLTMTDFKAVCEAMWGFEDGKHAAEMKLFLKDQYKRFEAGEDLKEINALTQEKPTAEEQIVNIPNSRKYSAREVALFYHIVSTAHPEKYSLGDTFSNNDDKYIAITTFIKDTFQLEVGWRRFERTTNEVVVDKKYNNRDKKNVIQLLKEYGYPALAIKFSNNNF